MDFKETDIKGVVICQPKVFGDERGFFMETYNQSEFRAAGIKTRFVQDNHSGSGPNVLRGLHFQEKPFSQAKLVGVAVGEVYDVVVDMRRQSSTFGQWLGFKLSSENKTKLFVPKGCAHGFLTRGNWTEFLYKVDNVRHPEAERGLNPFDPSLKIEWPVDRSKININDRDSKWPTLTQYYSLPNTRKKHIVPIT